MNKNIVINLENILKVKDIEGIIEYPFKLKNKWLEIAYMGGRRGGGGGGRRAVVLAHEVVVVVGMETPDPHELVHDHGKHPNDEANLHDRADLARGCAVEQHPEGRDIL